MRHRPSKVCSHLLSGGLTSCTSMWSCGQWHIPCGSIRSVLLYMRASLCLPFIFHSVSTAHVNRCLPDQYTERTSAHNHPINQRACQRVLPVGNSWVGEGISIVPPYQERQADKQTHRQTDRQTDRQIHSQTQRLGRQVDKEMRQTRECRLTCLRGQPLLQFDTVLWTACVWTRQAGSVSVKACGCPQMPWTSHHGG